MRVIRSRGSGGPLVDPLGGRNGLLEDIVGQVLAAAAFKLASH